MDEDKKSISNPHITGSYAPVEALMMSALRRFGTYSPGTIIGDVSLMMLEFANQVIEDVRSHPYWDGSEIEYYASLQDTRAIPDELMVSGLLFYYCLQQQSTKAQMYGPMYYRRMNQILYNRNYGSKKIEVNVTDRSPLGRGIEVVGPNGIGVPSIGVGFGTGGGGGDGGGV